nr:protein enabled homolog [Drosophila virilis]
MQPLPCLEAAATPAQRQATTSTTYINNPPPAAGPHCQNSCSRHNSNNYALSLPNRCHDKNMDINSTAPAFTNNSYNNAAPMIFVPFSVPVPHQQQQQQQSLQYTPQQTPSLPAVKNSMPPLGQTPAPPPPQPPPLVLPLAFHCHYPPPVPALPSLPQPPISGPLPPRAPPTPPPRIVLPLKAVAAAAIRAHQQNGKLPRNLPALRAMEMALRTNSFAATGGGIQPMEEADNSDSEMEYMIPLHSE